MLSDGVVCKALCIVSSIMCLRSSFLLEGGTAHKLLRRGLDGLFVQSLSQQQAWHFFSPTFEIQAPRAEKILTTRALIAISSMDISI